MNGKRVNQFPVYCVEGDLVGRYPFRGDTHLHNNFSNGHELPEVVCANYRRYGYDFLAITDHHRYYPSLRAMEFFREVPTGLCICPGEEVQLPPANGLKNNVHIINFGGLWSVNDLVPGHEVMGLGTDPAQQRSKILPSLLPTDTFPLVEIKKLYSMRWGIETSFCDLKYPLGLLHFHSKKTDLVYQEIYAHLLMYNFVSLMITGQNVQCENRKHCYKSSFSMAILASRLFFFDTF